MPAQAPHAWERPTPRETPPGRAPFGAKRPRGPGKGRAWALLLALIASVSLHLWLIAGAFLAQVLERLGGEDENPPPVVELVDRSQIPVFVPPPGSVPRETIEAPADAPQPELPERGRLVELAKPETAQQAPDDARFLAEHDHRAEKETAATETAMAPPVLAPEFRGTGDGDAESAEKRKGDPDKAAEGIGEAEKTEILRKAGEGGAAPDAKPKKTIDQMISNDPFGILARKPDDPDPARPAGDGRGGDDVRDAQSFEDGGGTRIAMAGGAPNNDYLPDVRPGDRTQLNAKEFVFASFWHRVQRQVEPFWVSNVRGANVSGAPKRDYMTRVDVTLAPDGKVLQVEITRSCGIPVWDRAVVEAFREAAPFLNPPPAMSDRDGLIRLPDLGFVVSLTGGQLVHSNVDPRAGKLFPGVREGGGPMR